MKHKWETVALVRLSSREDAKEIISETNIHFDIEENDQDGTIWARFLLPKEEGAVSGTHCKYDCGFLAYRVSVTFRVS